MQNRREFLKLVGSATAAAVLPARAATAPRTIGLGVNTYAFKRRGTAETIKAVADLGFDAIEISVLRGFSTEPANVSPAARREIRSQLGDRGLALPQIFERIPIVGDDAEHQAHLERIRRDAQFAHDVNAGVGGIRPVLGTHLSGNVKRWDELKNLVIERLHDWVRVAQEMDTIIAIKGHNLTLVDTSAKTRWVVEQVGSPWLRVVFDYSHFQFAGEELGAALETLFPYTVMVSLQDGRRVPTQAGMDPMLPGTGSVDYTDYFRRLVALGYGGYATCWFGEPFFDDPVGASRQCYDRLVPCMQQAGAVRPTRKARGRI